MTEQENRTHTALFDLIKVAGTLLRVELISHSNSFRSMSEDGKIKTLAIIYDGYVKLTLVEPTTQKELDDWGEAIVKAEELCNKIEKERTYDYNHPNFFRATLCKFNNMKNSCG